MEPRDIFFFIYLGLKTTSTRTTWKRKKTEGTRKGSTKRAFREETRAKQLLQLAWMWSKANLRSAKIAWEKNSSPLLSVGVFTFAVTLGVVAGKYIAARYHKLYSNQPPTLQRTIFQSTLRHYSSFGKRLSDFNNTDFHLSFEDASLAHDSAYSIQRGYPQGGDETRGHTTETAMPEEGR